MTAESSKMTNCLGSITETIDPSPEVLLEKLVEAPSCLIARPFDALGVSR